MNVGFHIQKQTWQLPRNCQVYNYYLISIWLSCLSDPYIFCSSFHICIEPKTNPAVKKRQYWFPIFFIPLLHSIVSILVTFDRTYTANHITTRTAVALQDVTFSKSKSPLYLFFRLFRLNKGNYGIPATFSPILDRNISAHGIFHCIFNQIWNP